MRIETELVKQYDNVLVDRYPKEFADLIISFCIYSFIHADYIESCKDEVDKYGISHRLGSDDFYHYDAGASKLNVDLILQDREELLYFLDESTKSELFHGLLNYLASSV